MSELETQATHPQLPVENLKSVKKWGAWVGYLSIIFGALNALAGLFLFVIGAVPGVLTILFGVFSLKASKNAERLIAAYNDNQMNELLENYGKSLKFFGIYYIFSIVLFVLIMLFYGALIFTMFAGSGGYYY